MAIPPLKIQEIMQNLRGAQESENNLGLEELIQRVQGMKPPVEDPSQGLRPIDVEMPPADFLPQPPPEVAEAVEIFTREGGEEEFGIDVESFVEFTKDNPEYLGNLQRHLDLMRRADPETMFDERTRYAPARNYLNESDMADIDQENKWIKEHGGLQSSVDMLLASNPWRDLPPNEKEMARFWFSLDPQYRTGKVNLQYTGIGKRQFEELLPILNRTNFPVEEYLSHFPWHQGRPGIDQQINMPIEQPLQIKVDPYGD